MPTNLEKFRALLQELFQLDQADLDFGIYRIMNTKRDEIVRFLDKDLLPQVKTALQKYQDAEKAELHTEIETAIQQAQSLGAAPEQLPKVMELRQKLAAGAMDLIKLENEVFSHLFNFFRRYYQDGDFISLRRYKEGVYAIPYEGEEVKLYWANHDQYYIKSSETFRDYTFKLDSGKRVNMCIVAASTEQNNNKEAPGKERRFILCPENPLVEENGELHIRFQYRASEGGEKQSDLNKQAIAAILSAPDFSTWMVQLGKPAPTEKDSSRTVLAKHLEKFTARNEFDYFIHKDLGGFLRRELDFYIKNEIMHLDDIEHQTAPHVEQYLSLIRVIRQIAHKIIAFLEQLENFQKKLWLKKKFVIETNYCITLDRIPEELYVEIAANDAQREEWVKLFAIDEIKAEKLGEMAYSNPMTVEFLKSQPFLVLDTKHFGPEFKRKLLASIHDLDEHLNGILIHSENFQALKLFRARFSQQIECVHIDPPYNTQTSGFLYANTYQHSSWLAMMAASTLAAIPLLSTGGSYLCHIDENEYERLHLLLDSSGIPDAGTVVWDKRHPMNAGRGIAAQHEYILWRTWNQAPLQLRNEAVFSILKAAAEIVAKNGGAVDLAKKEFSNWVANNPDLSGGEKGYRFLDDQGRPFQSVSLRAPEPRAAPKFHEPLIHPITAKPCPVPPNGFSRTPDTLKAMVQAGEILFGEDESSQPRQKVRLVAEKRRQMTSVIQEGRKGKADADSLGLSFPYCHPVSLYEDLIAAASGIRSGMLCDYFAGSGTTGHAVINLNREDGGNRKYILVEMAEYFHTVLMPRIKKVVYSKDWKDGKPIARDTGISHAFKYLKLESYEDALNNLELKRDQQQSDLLNSDPAMREQYMLSYMLDVESRGSQSLLNIGRFRNPDQYQLKVQRNGETQLVHVDLPETFNWLLGLTVKHIDVIRGVRVIDGKNPRGERVLVLWRNLDKPDEMDNDKLDQWFKKQKYNTREMEYDIFYVNGDNNLENLRRSDQTWKVRLIEEEFRRLMFEVQEV